MSDGNNDGNRYKTVIPILLGLFMILFIFFKFVLPALEPSDHGATGILEPTEEYHVEDLFGK